MSDCVAAWHLGNEEGTWTHKADSSVYGPPLPSATAARRAPQGTALSSGWEGDNCHLPPPAAPRVNTWMCSWSTQMEVYEAPTCCSNPRALLLPPRSRDSSPARTKDAQACNSEIRTAPASMCSRQLSVSI